MSPYSSVKEPNNVNYTKAKILAWAGHFVFSNNNRTLNKDIQHQTRWSKKSWKTKIAMGEWCWSRHENIRGQDLEEGRPQQRRMGKYS